MRLCQALVVADSGEATGLKWAAPAGGGGTAIVQRTTFSNVASQAFDNVFSSTYGSYFIIFEDIYAATNGDDLLMELRYAGPTDQTSDYYASAYNSNWSSTSFSFNNQLGTNQWTLTTETGSNTSPTSGCLQIFNVSGSSEDPNITGSFFARVAGNYWSIGGTQDTARVYTGFKIKSSSTNITGTITVLGVKTS